MDDWTRYVFQTVNVMLGHVEDPAVLADVLAFCQARTHNLWGENRNVDNPCVLMRHDVAAWMRSPLSAPLLEYKFSDPATQEFGFSEEKKEEMAALIQRYGTTPTGIGRIIIQMGRGRIWREPVTSSAGTTPEIATAWASSPNV